MRESDLQRVGLMICALIFVLSTRLPVVSISLVGMWAIVLVFDSIDNRMSGRKL